MKAVVFDMDGLLFDTERLCRDSWRIYAQKYGKPNVDEVFVQCIGTDNETTRQIVLKHWGADFDFDAFRRETRLWNEEQIEKNGLPIKVGAMEILAYLQSNGWKIGIASSSFGDVVKSHLTRAGVLDCFSAFATGDMVWRSKPEPDIYLMACRELGVEPGEAYAVEDSPSGIRAAYAAGMKPVMVPDLKRPDEEIKQMAHRICGDLLEVRALLEAGEL